MAATTGVTRQARALLFSSPSFPIQNTLNWGRMWPAWRRPESVRAYATHKKASSTSRIMKHALKRNPGTSSPVVEKTNAMKMSGPVHSELINVLLPGTFVPPPLSRFPRQPMTFLRFLWAWLSTRVRDEIQATIFKFASKPRLLQRATWRRNRRAVLPEAKALHRAMAEAFAAGDRDALGRVCVRKLQDSLSATITARPRGRRYGWELVRYNRAWSHPRIVDAKVLRLDQGQGAANAALVVHQVVVAIASRQRLVEYDDTPRGGGKVVPGSEKEVDLVENVVLTATIDFDTFKQSDWRILCTVGETKLEEWQSEKQMLKAMADKEMEKYKI